MLSSYSLRVYARLRPVASFSVTTWFSSSSRMGLAKSKNISFFAVGGGGKGSYDDTGAVKANLDPELLSKAKMTPEKMSGAEWEQVLTPIQYDVAREAGTERAFTGHLWDNKERGDQ